MYWGSDFPLNKSNKTPIFLHILPWIPSNRIRIWLATNSLPSPSTTTHKFMLKECNKLKQCVHKLRSSHVIWFPWTTFLPWWDVLSGLVFQIQIKCEYCPLSDKWWTHYTLIQRNFYLLAEKCAFLFFWVHHPYKIKIQYKSLWIVNVPAEQ